MGRWLRDEWEIFKRMRPRWSREGTLFVVAQVLMYGVAFGLVALRYSLQTAVEGLPAYGIGLVVATAFIFYLECRLVGIDRWIDEKTAARERR